MDHPRSRGEYARTKTARRRRQGSSPLSRGIRVMGCFSPAFTRIIPALAGNTTVGGHFEPTPKDHPRSRGEYGWGFRDLPEIPGSSPLSRGIQAASESELAERGIIPALAGNTLVDKGFYQPDLSDLGNPLLARLRFSKSLAPRLRRPPSWRGGSSGSASEGPGRTIRVSPS